MNEEQPTPAPEEVYRALAVINAHIANVIAKASPAMQAVVVDGKRKGGRVCASFLSEGPAYLKVGMMSPDGEVTAVDVACVELTDLGMRH